MSVLAVEKPAFMAEEDIAIFEDAVGKFFDEHAPEATVAKWRKNHCVDRDMWTKAGAAGLLGLSTPDQYGGAGGDYRHEVVLMEKVRDRANQIADEIGSVVIAHDGCEGKYLAQAGANRADIVAAVTGDDEDNLVICQMAKHHFDVPRTIARVNNPKNEELFKHLGVDELISPTRMILGSIEQDIPVHELLHLAALGEGELELIEAHLQTGSPAIGRAPRELDIPDGCSLFAVIRDGVASPLRPDTVLREGDKVIAIGKQECEDLLHGQLIGDPEAAATI